MREDIGTAVVGLAGESRTGDANSQFFRVAARTGGTTVVGVGEEGDDVLAALPDNTGFRPIPGDRPEYRPDVPCETQEPPDMSAPDRQDRPGRRPGHRRSAERRRAAP